MYTNNSAYQNNNQPLFVACQHAKICVREAALEKSVSQVTIRNWIHRGILQAEKCGRKYFVIKNANYFSAQINSKKRIEPSNHAENLQRECEFLRLRVISLEMQNQQLRESVRMLHDAPKTSETSSPSSFALVKYSSGDLVKYTGNSQKSPVEIKKPLLLTDRYHGLNDVNHHFFEYGPRS